MILWHFNAACFLSRSGIRYQFHSLWLELVGSCILRQHLGSSTVFGGPVLLTFLVFCFVLVCCVCLRPVSCAPNLASFSGLSIFHFRFSVALTFIWFDAEQNTTLLICILQNNMHEVLCFKNRLLISIFEKKVMAKHSTSINNKNNYSPHLKLLRIKKGHDICLWNTSSDLEHALLNWLKGYPNLIFVFK